MMSFIRIVIERKSPTDPKLGENAMSGGGHILWKCFSYSSQS